MKCHLRIAGQFPLALVDLPMPTNGTGLRLDAKYTILPLTLRGLDGLDIPSKGLILSLQISLQIQVEQRHVHQAHLHHQTGLCCIPTIPHYPAHYYMMPRWPLVPEAPRRKRSAPKRKPAKKPVRKPAKKPVKKTVKRKKPTATRKRAKK